MTFMLGILVLALVSSALISLVVSQLTEARFISEGIQMTNSFASQSRLALLYEAAENAELQAETVLGFPDVSKVSVFLPDGQVLLSKGEGEESLRVDSAENLSKKARLIFDTSDSWVFASKVTPSFVDNGIEAELEDLPPAELTLGYVQIYLSKHRLHALTQRVLMINSVIAISLASILLLFLRFITKRLTTPLENLSGIMKRAENGETQIRAELEGPKDIVDMEQAFNSMMSVLEQRESELKEARDSALETARSKAEFAAVVSHEIRTPLNGVLGMLNLLNEVGDLERQQEYLNVALSSGDKLMSLINDILDFSKLDAGKLEVDLSHFNLRDALEDVSALFVEKAQSKDVELCLDLPSDLPRIVVGDVNRLHQILNNLLSNAIKFTDYGEVILSVRTVKLNNARIRADFAIKDTGIGIPDEAKARIFESFRQADRGIARNFGGTGLGLTICKQLVELMGGQLEVQSKPNVGSTFSFSTEFEVKEDYTQELCFQGTPVILADKNAVTLEYLQNNLESWGCVCQSSGSEAEVLQNLFQVLQTANLAICIVDPAACESEFTCFIQEIHQTAKAGQQVKIVLLTRPCFSEIDTRNIDATIDKPVRLAALKRVISQVIDADPSKSLSAERMHTIRSVTKYYRGRLLVVDDNRTNQMVAKSMLMESGFLADVASDGHEALRLAQDNLYELILMDCNMPVMDGYEATRKIRELNGENGQVPIFAMTAVDNPNEIRRCLDVGMNDFLLKPINLTMLRKKMAKLFDLNSDAVSRVRTDKASSIDDESFNSLAKAVGDKVGEIINAFFADTPNYLDQLGAAIKIKDWRRVKSLSHTLKGSSNNLGANVFGSICREIEELLAANDISEDRVYTLVSDLKTEYSYVVESLLEKQRAREWSGNAKDAGEHKLVLVVDDDRSIRLTIARGLEADGMLVEQAGDGQQAIEKFIQFNPDLIIMDAMMPVKDGFTASREIKQLPNGRRTEILIITGLENEESVEAAFKNGATDFITKPIHLTVLRHRVRRILAARQSDEQVKKLAYIDDLTRLPNRIAFRDRLLQDIAYARRNGNRLAVLFIDIDHFKDVNDNLGHAAGDELLWHLARRVGRCVREEDTLARLGGDEFVVVLGSISSPKGADTAAQHILKALSAPFYVAKKEIYVGASIGISIFPDDGYDSKTLLKNADTAMYRAKALGRNNYQFYTVEMSTSIAERLNLESDLRRVLQNDELTLYYQPKLELQSSRIVGAEALVRWKHPYRGFMLPNSFIPFAEESGLINEIGAWCMLTACKQFKTWQDEKGFTGRVAVNASVREFMSPAFVGSVRDCLRRSGLSGEYLEIEITENTVLEYDNETLEKLNQLANMGVAVAIDDFGVGYSAFSYLKRMKVQVLKIDRSFVRDVPEDRSGAAVIDGMIQLAHKLDLQVVAEGVEFSSQIDFLREHGCDLVQGFLIGKPMPSLEFYNKFILHENVKSAK